MNPDDSSLNPYESPKAIEGRSFSGEPWLTAYQPAAVPRDVLDVFLGLALGVVANAVVIGIPIAILYGIQAPVIYFWLPIVAIVVPASLAMAAAIRQVELTADELIARRLLLPPLRIRWGAVTAVRTAGRWEALFSAILRPHRCCSYTLTSRDVVCIDCGNSKLLFPAKDTEAFRGSARLLAARHNPDFVN